MSDLPDVGQDVAPRDVLAAVGCWRADQLADDWRFLPSRGTVQRVCAGYVHQGHLQGRTGSRTGNVALAAVEVLAGARRPLARRRRRS